MAKWVCDRCNYQTTSALRPFCSSIEHGTLLMRRVEEPAGELSVREALLSKPEPRPVCACGATMFRVFTLENGTKCCGDCAASYEKDLDVRELPDRIAAVQPPEAPEPVGWCAWATPGDES